MARPFLLRCLTLIAALAAALANHSASAQGLLWNLPAEDGTEVRFEGTYRQTEARPDSNEGNLEIEWIQHLTVKSVGKEDGQWNGETVPCRWIEIKIQTGKSRNGVINTGSVGERIYKVLVPEAAITGKIKDEEGLPVSYIPIVKGWRKLSDKDPTPREIKSSTLQVYPVIAHVRHYKNMTEAELPETVQVGMQSVEAKKLRGSMELESRLSRVSHECELYRSDDVPFGLARWTAKIIQEEKTAVDVRTEFKLASEITIDMTARYIGTGARSELVIP